MEVTEQQNSPIELAFRMIRQSRGKSPSENVRIVVYLLLGSSRDGVRDVITTCRSSSVCVSGASLHNRSSSIPLFDRLSSLITKFNQIDKTLEYSSGLSPLLKRSKATSKASFQSLVLVSNR